jgi:hypothetical protein
MVSRENRVVLSTGTAALILLYVFATIVHAPSWVSTGVVLVVGVVLPQPVNDYLDRQETGN